MADGGKTPVTRGGSKGSNALPRTPTTDETKLEPATRDSANFNQEQGKRGSVQLPRSRSPTKRPTSPSDTTATRSRAIRSPPRENGSRRISQGPGSTAATPTPVGAPGTASPPNSLHAPGLKSPAQLSNSVPATPYVHARRYSNEQRTPSPIPGSVQTDGNISPRSVRSDSDSRVRPSQRNLFPAPCRFETGLAASRRRIPYSLGGDMLEKAPEPVKEKLTKEEEDKLTREMQTLYEKHLLPTQESEDRRSKFKEKLERIINERWPGNDIKVHVFGSSGNLLCTSESDVDICIRAPPNVIGRMCNLAHCLAGKGMERVVCIPQAKVPIVKIWDPEYKLACDMNVNNTAAIENTRMVRTYVMVDPRVRPLAMVVKHWTRRRVLNDAALGGTLSSYTWISLLIHFLQSRKPPILPSLQQRPHQCTVHEDGKRSSFADDVESLSSYGKGNKATIGELLFGFFRYFAHEFDYENNVISIRTGKLLSKKEKRWHLSVNNRLCIEEPFNTDRNLGNTADDISFRGVHLEIRRAFNLLCENKLDECCEQYEFPQEQERFWQKPAPQPLPVLTRSRSQTNRSSRSSETGGGRNNNKGRHSKGVGSGRRASSAAASNKNNMIFTPPMQQGQWLVEGGQMSGQMIHEQLSQHMSMLQQQEAYYKLQQQHMAIAQTHAHSVAQMPHLQAGGSRHAQSMRENPRRSSAIEPGPLSAPLRNVPSAYAFPFPQTSRSGSATPAVAHTKHTATNPSSPSLGTGRLAPMDPRRHSHRPLTPEGSDMARSRSQPPISSRDGPPAPTDQVHGRFIYPTGLGGALAGYPGLQHYQQQYLQAKERQVSRQPHQLVQSQSQEQPQQEQGRHRPESLRLDGQESEDRDHEIINSDYAGYILEGLTPAQQMAALQNPAHFVSSLPHENRSERLLPPDMQRLRGQWKERTSRSPSPSTSSFSRDRSFSTQSSKSAGQSNQTPRQPGSLPTFLSSPSTGGGPIIIDGSGDSPSDGQPSHSSGPSSVYDSASSDVTATENEQQNDLNNFEFGPLPDEAPSSKGPSIEDRNSTPAYPPHMIPHGPIHFGELPMNPSQIPYSSREQFARQQRMPSFPEHPNIPRQQQQGQSSSRNNSSPRAASLGSQGTGSWYDQTRDMRPEFQRPNGFVSGLGIDVESAISSGGQDSDGQEDEACQETPKATQASDSKDKGSTSNVFHQQLPQGMANGSAVKQNLTNVLKPAPLLSPVREVRTPSPTTSRTRSSLQSQGVLGQEDGKQKSAKENKKTSLHARAVSLLSGEAMHSRDDDLLTQTKKPSSRSDMAPGGDRTTGGQGRGEVRRSEDLTQVHTPVSPMPLSYSAMARKTSQTHGEQQQKLAQSRPPAHRTNSGSVSPRSRSPNSAVQTNGSIQGNLSAAWFPTDISPPTSDLVTTRGDKARVRSTDVPLYTSAAHSSQSRESTSTAATQRRQQRAQQTKELADSVAHIDLSSTTRQPQSGGKPENGARQSPTQRNLGHTPLATAAPGQQWNQASGPQSRENSNSQQGGSVPSGVGSNSSGWQQATKRRGKKNNQNTSSSSTSVHRRQTNSIGGTILPSELGEKGG